MTLDQHLAAGYDFYVHGVSRKWNPRMLVEEISRDDNLRRQAVEKHNEVKRVMDAGRQCDVTRIQKRILDKALEAA